MALDERVSQLIGDIYLNEPGSPHWETVCRSILSLTDSRAIMVGVYDRLRAELRSAHLVCTDEEAGMRTIGDYAAEMWRSDPALLYAGQHPQAGYFSTARHGAHGDPQFEQHMRWYRDRLGSDGWALYYQEPDDDLMFGASLNANAGEAVDDPDRLKLFRLFYTHLENATRLAARPLHFDADDGGHATILVDGFGRVRHISTSAAALLAANDGLSVSGIRLAVPRAGDQSRIDAALRVALSALDGGGHGADLVLERPSGKRPYLLSVRANPRPGTPFDMYRPSVVVTIVDPEQHGAKPAAERWQALFGLTRTEAKLADTLLAPGADVADAANSLGMAQATARVHLRNIFRKVGVHRQTDLLRLLMRLG